MKRRNQTDFRQFGDLTMKLSARNQFPGTVTKVAEGAVNGIVTIDVNGTPVSGIR